MKRATLIAAILLLLSTPVAALEADTGEAAVEPQITSLVIMNPICYQPNPARNTCWVNFQMMYVDSSPAPRMDYLTVYLGGQTVARLQGYSGTSISFYNDLLAKGFKVRCGLDGAGGKEGYGNRYEFGVLAVDSNGTPSYPGGVIYCPAFVGRVEPSNP